MLGGGHPNPVQKSKSGVGGGGGGGGGVKPEGLPASAAKMYYSLI